MDDWKNLPWADFAAFAAPWVALWLIFRVAGWLMAVSVYGC